MSAQDDLDYAYRNAPKAKTCSAEEAALVRQLAIADIKRIEREEQTRHTKPGDVRIVNVNGKPTTLVIGRTYSST